jgi:antitoxin (DNA-binding transcriptional repressor) of toxin-antitoxin stability system
MIEATTMELEHDLQGYLAKVEEGESVVILREGRAVARLLPGLGFMEGKEFAKLFADYQPDELDKAAAEEIEKHIAEMNMEAERDLDH